MEPKKITLKVNSDNISEFMRYLSSNLPTNWCKCEFKKTPVYVCKTKPSFAIANNILTMESAKSVGLSNPVVPYKQEWGTKWRITIPQGNYQYLYNYARCNDEYIYLLCDYCGRVKCVTDPTGLKTASGLDVSRLTVNKWELLDTQVDTSTEMLGIAIPRNINLCVYVEDRAFLFNSSVSRWSDLLIVPGGNCRCDLKKIRKVSNAQFALEYNQTVGGWAKSGLIMSVDEAKAALPTVNIELLNSYMKGLPVTNEIKKPKLTTNTENAVTNEIKKPVLITDTKNAVTYELTKSTLTTDTKNIDTNENKKPTVTTSTSENKKPTVTTDTKNIDTNENKKPTPTVTEKAIPAEKCLTPSEVLRQRMLAYNNDEIGHIMRITDGKLPSVAYKGMRGTGLISKTRWVHVFVELFGEYREYTGIERVYDRETGKEVKEQRTIKGMGFHVGIYCITGPGAFSLVEKMERDDYYFCENDMVKMDDGWMFCTPYPDEPFEFICGLVYDIQQYGYDVIVEIDASYSDYDYALSSLKKCYSEYDFRQLVEEHPEYVERFVEECPDFIIGLFTMAVRRIEKIIYSLYKPVVGMKKRKLEGRVCKPFWVITNYLINSEDTDSDKCEHKMRGDTGDNHDMYFVGFDKRCRVSTYSYEDRTLGIFPEFTLPRDLDGIKTLILAFEGIESFHKIQRIDVPALFKKFLESMETNGEQELTIATDMTNDTSTDKSLVEVVLPPDEMEDGVLITANEIKNGVYTIPVDCKEIEFGAFLDYTGETLKVVGVLPPVIRIRNADYGLFTCGAKRIDLSELIAIPRDMDYWFYNCKNVQEIDLGGVMFNEVKSMNYCFCNCSNLESLKNFIQYANFEWLSQHAYQYGDKYERLYDKFGTFDFGEVRSRIRGVLNLDCCFSGCSSLTELDIQELIYRDYDCDCEYPEAIEWYNIFEHCAKLEVLKFSLSPYIAIAEDLFIGCCSLKEVHCSRKWTDKRSVSYSDLFRGVTSLKTLELNGGFLCEGDICVLTRRSPIHATNVNVHNLLRRAGWYVRFFNEYFAAPGRMIDADSACLFIYHLGGCDLNYVGDDEHTYGFDNAGQYIWGGRGPYLDEDFTGYQIPFIDPVEDTANMSVKDIPAWYKALCFVYTKFFEALITGKRLRLNNAKTMPTVFDCSLEEDAYKVNYKLEGAYMQFPYLLKGADLSDILPYCAIELCEADEDDGVPMYSAWNIDHSDLS